MATCTSCGADVTGKKFCPECGSPVQTASAVASPTVPSNVCPRCNGEVSPGAAFCMHCGSALSAQHAAPPPPPQPTFCTNCGKQAAPDARFCQGCGSPLGVAVPMQQGQYPQYQQPQPQYAQPQYQQPQQAYTQAQYQQPYPQQYAQGGYPQQQQPMVLRCPTCQAMAAVGTPACPGCHTSLANIVPTPANMPVGQQGGVAGFLQGNNGKMVMGALGGAAAVLGGEMLLGGVEHSIERSVERDMGGGYGYGEHRHHHQREGGLGELGEIANDLGLF
jgi:predicted amidophosphoribosyltransferase